MNEAGKNLRKDYLKTLIKTKKRTRILIRRLFKRKFHKKINDDIETKLNRFSVEFEKIFSDGLNDIEDSFKKYEKNAIISVFPKQLIAGEMSTSEAKIETNFLDENLDKIAEKLIKNYIEGDYNGISLSDKIWKTTKYTKEQIMAQIEKMRKSEDTYKEIIEAIEPFMKEKTTFNAMRLLRSEYGDYYARRLYKQGDYNPAYQGIIWRLSSEHRNRMPQGDICDKYANNTSYGKRGYYPKGKEPAYPHPQCMCSQFPAVKTADEFEKELFAWLDGGKNEMLDKFYKGDWI